MCQIRASHRAMPQCVDAISISLCHRCNLIFSSRDHLDKYLMIILTNTCWSYLWGGKANHDVVRHSQLSWLQWHCGYLKFCRQTILFLRRRTCRCKSFPLNSVDRSAKLKENSQRRRGFEKFFFVRIICELIWLLEVSAFVDDDVQGWQGRSYKLQEMQGFKKKVDSASRLAPHSQQVPSPTYQGMQPKGQSNPPKSPPPSRVSLKIGTK